MGFTWSDLSSAPLLSAMTFTGICDLSDLKIASLNPGYNRAKRLLHDKTSLFFFSTLPQCKHRNSAEPGGEEGEETMWPPLLLLMEEEANSIFAEEGRGRGEIKRVSSANTSRASK